MKNTLEDLNNYLFETLERITDDDLSDEQLQRELLRSDAVVKVSEAVIHNGELALRALNAMQEYGVGNLESVPAMLNMGRATSS